MAFERLRALPHCFPSWRSSVSRRLLLFQAGAIPALLAGHDMVGQSQTGSGKTVAFALPILERLATIQGDVREVEHVT